MFVDRRIKKRYLYIQGAITIKQLNALDSKLRLNETMKMFQTKEIIT